MLARRKTILLQDTVERRHRSRAFALKPPLLKFIRHTKLLHQIVPLVPGLIDVSEINKDYLRLRINSLHQRELTGDFVRVFLVDTDCVYPNWSILENIFLLPICFKGALKTCSNQGLLTVDVDRLIEGCLTPDIR